MIIRRLSVKNIRSHTEKVIDLSEGTTVLIGKNGAGKTSLIESIYLALQGTSFKGTDSDMLRYETPWWRIELLLDDETIRSVTHDPSRQSGKKQFVINDKKSYRLSPRDKYPVVLFEPEDLRLLNGSPSRRRDFIDHILIQLDPLYSTTMRKYDRALKQRNTLLKNGFLRNEDIFIWNIALSEYGAKIIEQRIYATEVINKEINNYYNEIAHTNDIVTVHYSHTSIDYSAQKLLKELESNLERDKILKHTSIGPHRHDIIFKFNNSLALSVASRGEVRSIILALKKIEVVIIEKLTGRSPIVLLDDVYSELDDDRQLSITNDNNQRIITSTRYENIDKKALVIKL